MKAEEIGSFEVIAKEIANAMDIESYKDFLAKMVRNAAKRLSESFELSSRLFESAFEASGKLPTNSHEQAHATMTRLERLSEMADSVLAGPTTFTINKYENEEIASQFWVMLRREIRKEFERNVRPS